MTRALKMCDVFSFQRHQAGSPVPAQATYLYRHTRMCACTHAHTHTHMHTHACTVLTSFFSLISFSHSNSMFPAYLLLFYSDHLSQFLFIPSSVISPLFLNLGITGLDIEVRILLCFSRLLTLCTRFRNPRRLATREPSVRTE